MTGEVIPIRPSVADDLIEAAAADMKRASLERLVRVWVMDRDPVAPLGRPTRELYDEFAEFWQGPASPVAGVTFQLPPYDAAWIRAVAAEFAMRPAIDDGPAR